jgi:hypothetical protein
MDLRKSVKCPYIAVLDPEGDACPAKDIICSLLSYRKPSFVSCYFLHAQLNLAASVENRLLTNVSKKYTALFSNIMTNRASRAS